MEVAAGLYKRVIFPGDHPDERPRLSDLQKAMLDATPDCVKVISTSGKLLTMNKAGCLALGVPLESEFGMEWLPLLAGEVHDAGTKALRLAAHGQSARFSGQSQSAEGFRYWDNLLTPVVDEDGNVVSILCVSRDVTTQTELKQDLEAAIGREKLLSREMQHRIKNLFAVVSGLIGIAEKEAAQSEVPAIATKILRGKLSALARASDAAFSSADAGGPKAIDVDVGSLVRSVLEPYGDRCDSSGDGVSVCHNNMTTLALFIHELATNSVKYGALGAEGGVVTVRWLNDNGALLLTWTESGGPSIQTAPARHGFGSEMVDRIVQSACGTARKSWPRDGLVAELRLPLGN